MTIENCKTAKFYYCPYCGNLIQVLQASGQPMVCCGQQMKELKPGVTDATVEKHVPTFSRKDDRLKVCIGSEPHPMTEEHYIQWVEVVTNEGHYWKCLKPDQKPKVCFNLHPDEKVTAVYAYCNLHKLWMA